MKFTRLTLAVLTLTISPPVFAKKIPTEPGLKAKLEQIFSNFLRREITVETLRWRFPARYKATNVTLWEKPGLAMVESPTATMKVSLKTLWARRYYISQMKFPNATATLRYTHDGKTNVTNMIRDLVDHARATYKPGQRQKAVYNVFKIQNMKMDVVDAETGNRPFGAAFLLNAKGDIDGLGPQTKFPFSLTAVHLSSGSLPMEVRLGGTIGNRPVVHGEAQRVPISILNSYLPIVRYFDGNLSARADFSKAGLYKFWQIKGSTKGIKLKLPLPFPVISAEAMFHAYAQSHFKLVLRGHSTQIDTLIKVLSLQSKQITLTMTSKDGDIQECIDWFGTGYLLNQDSPEAILAAREGSVPVWKVSGTGDINAELKSIMGPRLIRELDGQIGFTLHSGVLTEIPGFMKAINLLNLSSAFFGNETQSPGLEFGKAAGTVDIKDGVALTRGMIIFEGKELNVGVMGRINVPKNVINANMMIGIVSLPDTLISRIPFVRRLSTGNKEVIPIWLEIKGPINNPNVRILSIKMFDRELWKSMPAAFQKSEDAIKEMYR